MYTVYKRVADLLNSVTPTFIGDPPDAAEPPYAFVWGEYPTKHPIFLDGARNVVDTELQCTCVAASPANTLALASRVEKALDGALVEVPGFYVEPLHVVASSNLQTQHGVFQPASNRYPVWIVLSIRVRAVRVNS